MYRYRQLKTVAVVSFFFLVYLHIQRRPSLTSDANPFILFYKQLQLIHHTFKRTFTQIKSPYPRDVSSLIQEPSSVLQADWESQVFNLHWGYHLGGGPDTST